MLYFIASFLAGLFEWEIGNYNPPKNAAGHPFTGIITIFAIGFFAWIFIAVLLFAIWRTVIRFFQIGFGNELVFNIDWADKNPDAKFTRREYMIPKSRIVINYIIRIIIYTAVICVFFRFLGWYTAIPGAILIAYIVSAVINMKKIPRWIAFGDGTVKIDDESINYSDIMCIESSMGNMDKRGLFKQRYVLFIGEFGERCFLLGHDSMNKREEIIDMLTCLYMEAKKRDIDICYE
jgi:hypothetical protein